MRLAFLGLGVMGFPMAGHLARAGHELVVFNRTAAKAADWVERHGGRSEGEVGAAVAGADMALACVGDDPDAEEVADAAFAGMKAGALYVDHTTTSAELARRLAARAAEKGLGFVDAPVSGGQAGAEKGALTVMCGGEAAHVERARPVLDAFAARIVRIGEAGAGQTAKMANQMCIAGIVQGLAEALHFVQAADLDPALVIEAISGGAAQSWQMENRWRTMVEDRFDFGFAVDWMRKDLRIALEEARRVGAPAPVTALVDQFYAEVQAKGGGRWDTSSLITRLKT